ncbi:uncharacterized protein V6R79_015829 [Siganus canaliculatus]
MTLSSGRLHRLIRLQRFTEEEEEEEKEEEEKKKEESKGGQRRWNGNPRTLLCVSGDAYVQHWNERSCTKQKQVADISSNLKGVPVRGGSESPPSCHGSPPFIAPPALYLPLSDNYYCCKKNDSEVDMGSVVGADPLSHFPCNTCNALAMDGTAINPVSLDQLETGSHHNHCPTCSPYLRRSGLTDNMRNGGERLGFHTYYENPSVSLPLSANPQSSSPLNYCSHTDAFPPPPRPYSTQV